MVRSPKGFFFEHVRAPTPGLTARICREFRVMGAIFHRQACLGAVPKEGFLANIRSCTETCPTPSHLALFRNLFPSDTRSEVPRVRPVEPTPTSFPENPPPQPPSDSVLWRLVLTPTVPAATCFGLRPLFSRRQDASTLAPCEPVANLPASPPCAEVVTAVRMRKASTKLAFSCSRHSMARTLHELEDIGPR